MVGSAHAPPIPACLHPVPEHSEPTPKRSSSCVHAPEHTRNDLSASHVFAPTHISECCGFLLLDGGGGFAVANSFRTTRMTALRVRWTRRLLTWPAFWR